VKINKYSSLGVAIALFLFVGTGTMLIYPFDVSESGITVNVMDMEYACGDCYVRFGVTGAYDNEGNLITNFNAAESRDSYKFVGWDVIVIYRGEENFLQSYQEKLASNNVYCSRPLFRLKGRFKRKFIYKFIWDGYYYDGLYFDATSGVAINNDPGCKTVPRETILP
jgi:hypothetical protein